MVEAKNAPELTSFYYGLCAMNGTNIIRLQPDYGLQNKNKIGFGHTRFGFRLVPVFKSFFVCTKQDVYLKVAYANVSTALSYVAAPGQIKICYPKENNI